MIILIHGFNVSDPNELIGKITRHLKDSIMFTYGWRILSVLWHNKKDAKSLKKLIKKTSGGITVIGHSNGCAITNIAAKKGAKIDLFICINPALKCKTIFPASIKNILVIHTKHDVATRLARFFDKVPFIQLIIPNSWGAMGAKGYKGIDSRVVNWDMSDLLEGHSDFAIDENLDVLMPMINEHIKKLVK